MSRAALGLFLVVLTFVPVAVGFGGEPPGFWLLNARDTGDDWVRVAVGGTAERPPTELHEVLLGWVWDEGATSDAGTGSEPLPDTKRRGVYKALEQSDNRARRWRARTGPSEAEGIDFPPVGLGPARELWLVDRPGSRARGWAALLDAIEATYRHSVLDDQSPPLGVMPIGFLGRCTVFSITADTETGRDTWSPHSFPTAALPSREGGSYIAELTVAEARDQGRLRQVRFHRFLRWLALDEEGDGCLGDGESAALRLFSLPASENKEHFLTFEGIRPLQLDPFGLDPDLWEPGVRGFRELPAMAPPAVLRLTPEQQASVAAGASLELCMVTELLPWCRRSAELRRRLFTAVSAAKLGPQWPEERIRAVQESCRRILAGNDSESDPCGDAAAWAERVSDHYVASFSGVWTLSKEPPVREDFANGTVSWRLPLGDPLFRQALGATDRLELRFIDGTVLGLDPQSLLPAPRIGVLSGGAGAASITALAVALVALLISLLTLRAARRARTDLDERQLRAVIDRRLAAVLKIGGSNRLGRLSEEIDRRAHLQAESTVEETVNNLASDQEVLRRLVAEEVRRQAGLRPVPSTWSERLPGTAAEASGQLFRDLRLRIQELPDDLRARCKNTLEAGGQLGLWVGQLWPPLEAAAGAGAPALADDLPPPARQEWRHAFKVLRSYAVVDARAFLRLISPLNDSPPSPAEEELLRRSGLGDRAADIGQELRSYLEPYDRPGRLSAVILALQYLVEAYPIEQLDSTTRAVFRRQLAECLRTAELPEDFHLLIGKMAAGIGLHYRPLRYYQSRVDQPEHSFARQMISAIPLSDLVGFAATAEPTVVVRLERPFFFDLDHDTYYAGHAQVARG